MGEREKRTSFFFLMAFEDDDDTDIGYSINKILKNLAILYYPTWIKFERCEDERMVYCRWEGKN